MFATISQFRFRRHLAPVLIALTIAGLTAACDDDDDLLEPEVQTIRLVVGANTYNIDRATGLTGNIVIGQTANNVTATFLRANGEVETLVTGTEFELRLDDLNTALATFTRTGPFTGTLTGIAAGTDTQVFVRLFHLEEGHADFSMNVTLQVN